MRLGKSSDCFLYLVAILVVWLFLQTPPAQGQSPFDNSFTVRSDQQFLNRLRLSIDGVETGSENMPLLLASGRTVISLQALQNIIPCQSEWGQDGELVVIWEQSRIQLYPDKNQMLVNAIPQTLEITPYTSEDGSFMLPLRALGEAMGYQITYNEASQSIQLNSPGYQSPPQTVIPAVEV